ncbi:hypothetical protein HYPSUDRAFT_894778 [Hypholoma sublateritium FD-334 SS-4]|uniref:Uncharacterized protein n=1 Tax=Hypholoma sublateritium (strain FD-334 SS-4) TaxID=945553 RepID=A0A0D2NK62_HYPSF|nr:hypothetical protein HYPSUDRAFT_894778 [Hypholoma sublateritium FD-334 SS-4]
MLLDPGHDTPRAIGVQRGLAALLPPSYQGGPYSDRVSLAQGRLSRQMGLFQRMDFCVSAAFDAGRATGASCNHQVRSAPMQLQPLPGRRTATSEDVRCYRCRWLCASSHIPISRVCTSPYPAFAPFQMTLNTFQSLVESFFAIPDYDGDARGRSSSPGAVDTDAALVGTLLPCANSEWYSKKPRLSVEPLVGLGSGISSYSRMHYPFHIFWSILPTKQNQKGVNHLFRISFVLGRMLCSDRWRQHAWNSRWWSIYSCLV